MLGEGIGEQEDLSGSDAADYKLGAWIEIDTLFSSQSLWTQTSPPLSLFKSQIFTIFYFYSSNK